MKKRLICIVAILVFLAAFWTVGTGFLHRADVVLNSFEQDGETVVLNASVMSSAGYVRAASAKQDGDGCLVRFNCTFGGFNSPIGARNTFAITVPDECTKICFERDNGSEAVLIRDTAGGEWRKA